MATRKPTQDIKVKEFAAQIEGLSDLRRALKAIGDEYPDQLKQANIALADGIVSGSLRRAAGVSPLANKAAKSLRAMKSAANASVRGGGARYPYFFGAEFGSKRYRQFKAWRGNQFTPGGQPGYFLHPTIREDSQQLLIKYREILDRLHATAFPEGD